MTENQELYTKWLRECPGAEHVSIELSRDRGHPYCWKVGATNGSSRCAYVMLTGPSVNGTKAQIREILWRQLKNALAKLIS
jgi:hypothetical protein